MSYRKTILLGVLIATMIGAPVGAQQPGVLRARTAAEDLQMFSQALNQIRVNHPDSLDMHELFVAAVEGLVSAADPHSYVLPSARLTPEREKEYRDGKLVRIPVEFVYFGRSPIVLSVAARSSASQLDVLPGDELIAIDGQPVLARSAEELAIVLAGKRGTRVSLSFERQRIDGSLVQLTRVVERERVEAESAVPAGFMLDPVTGYVRITDFMNERVAEDLHRTIEGLEKTGMQRLLLDLRDNGGGSVTEAAHVAGEFLPAGTVVYTSEGRKQDVAETGRVKRSFWKSERRYPVVVLVNSGTASAAELVAGALQDHDRALIVGRPTFGKSLLMRGFPLSDGSILMLVVGHMKTPCGRVIQRQYRGISDRAYFRLARADRDTVGRPSCTTSGGRVVYGGGGIYPDVMLPRRSGVPRWLSEIREEELPLKWIGGFLNAYGDAFISAESLAGDPSLPEQALDDFRGFAARNGITVPSGADSEVLVRNMILLQVAATRWGDVGYYRVAAALDPEVRVAVDSFIQAEALPSAARQ